MGSAQHLMKKTPEEIAEFSDEDIAAARVKIAAHTVIGHLWHKPFNGQQKQAAISWLTYKDNHPTATLEQWFGQFDNSILPATQSDRPWRI